MTRDVVKKNLLVFVGAGLGGVARYTAGSLVASFIAGPFPWGTFAVNVTGCLAMGGLMYLFRDRGLLAPGQRLFLMVGLLGGYTTFSSFGYESDALLKQGRMGLEIVYAAASALFGLAAVWAGRAGVRGLERLALSSLRSGSAAAPRGTSPELPRPLSPEEEPSE